ncbi:MAG: NADP-reducing hydrogenase subunit HndA [Firmicutes bacterium]|nr:NADP-reducing hydrogenase subunit HndA [Bacillota bacterium]
MTESKCVGCTGSYTRDEKWDQLDEVMAKHKALEGALIMILHRAQLIFGYLPEDVQRYVAKSLNIPLADVYGVTTFYSSFSLTPRGKHRIAVCMGTACYVRGAGDLLTAFEKALGVKVGQTTTDGLFTLEASRCIGACGLAPVLTVGEDVYGNIMSAERVPDILRKYRAEKQQSEKVGLC